MSTVEERQAPRRRLIAHLGRYLQHCKKYIMVIVDDYTHITWLFLLRLKSKTPQTLMNFIREIELKIKLPIRRIRSDNGTEFTNRLLNDFLVSKGINHNISAPYTPQQNSMVERRNIIIVEVARPMINFSNLPLYFWAEVVSTSCFVQNQSIINKRLNKTPYEGLNNRKPNVRFFSVFGCRCFVINNKEHLIKFAPKSEEGIVLGYSTKKR